MAKHYLMIRFNGYVQEDETVIEPKVVSVVRSLQAVQKEAKNIDSPNDYSVFKCFPKFEAAYYQIADFERDESDEGTPLTKYLPK